MSISIIDFSSSFITFNLRSPTDTKVPRFIGQQIRGIALNLISQIDPNLSTQMHRANDVRAYAVSNIFFKNSQPKRNRDFIFVSPSHQPSFLVKTVSKDISSTLLSSLMKLQNQVILLKDKPFLIENIQLSTDHYTDNYFSKQPLSEVFHIDFRSPTQFSLKSSSSVYLFPDPRFLFGNLATQAADLSLTTAQFDREGFHDYISKNIYIRRYDLFTRQIRMGNKLPPFVGFCGKCTFIIKELDGFYSNLLPFLVKVGEILNVGNKRSAGMGTIKGTFLPPRT